MVDEALVQRALDEYNAMTPDKQADFLKRLQIALGILPTQPIITQPAKDYTEERQALLNLINPQPQE